MYYIFAFMILKIFSKKLLLGVCLIASGYASIAQISNWTQMLNGELEGGDIRSYLYHKGVLYAGTRGGIFKTTDKGLQWTYTSNGIGFENSLEINWLTQLNDTLFAATTYGLAKSTDAGVTWTSCTDPGDMRQYIDRVFAIGNRLVVTAKTPGNQWKMFSSTDYGKTWVSGSHIFIKRPYIYKVRNDFVLIDRGSDSLYTTTDGLTITHFPTINLPPGAILESFTGDTAVTSNYVYAIVDYAGIYRLNLTNGVWEDSVNTIYPRAELYNLYYFNNKLIVCGVDYNPYFKPNLYISYDQGLNWLRLPAPFGVQFPMMQQVIWMGGNDMMATFYYENFYSSNGGLNWGKRSGGLYASKSTFSLTLGNTILTSFSYKGIIRSTDNGLNWNLSNTGIDSPEIFVNDLIKTRDRVYASLKVHLGDTMRLYQSANNGVTWTRCTLPTGMYEFDLLGYNDSTLFIRNRTGSNVFVYRSTNYGQSFENVQTKLPVELTTGVGSVTSIIGARDTLLIHGKDALGYSKLFISTDNAETFTGVNNGVPSAVGSEVLKVLPGSSYFLAVIRNFTDSIKYFINGKWINAKGQNLPEQPKLFTLDQVGERLFAATNRGVYVSINYGYSWIFVDYGPYGGVAISKFFATPQYLFVSTQNDGIWRNTLQVGIAPKQSPSAGIAVVYPNPAQNKAVIQLPSAFTQPMQLVVFDIQGKMMYSQTAEAGENKLELITSDWVNGLYFFKLNGEENYVGKLLVQH
jgi:photosystem II stability/assembly factor-like uncharacterized protein